MWINRQNPFPSSFTNSQALLLVKSRLMFQKTKNCSFWKEKQVFLNYSSNQHFPHKWKPPNKTKIAPSCNYKTGDPKPKWEQLQSMTSKGLPPSPSTKTPKFDQKPKWKSKKKKSVKIISCWLITENKFWCRKNTNLSSHKNSNLSQNLKLKLSS